MNHIWNILKIEPTSDKREIRKAYAALSKIYHVEEHPEEFAEIQQAYHAALEQAENKNIISYKNDSQESGIKADFPDKTDSKTEDSIVSKLDELRQQQKSAYSNKEVIDQMTALFLDKTGQDRQQMWQEFFLSDAFLFVHDREGFIDELIQAFACQRISVEKLEPVFLKELALVYGIVSFGDIRNYTPGNKGAVEHLLLEQENTDWAYTEGDAKLVNRSYSFYYFRRLCKLAGEGGLKDYQTDQWGNLAFYAEDNYCSKNPADNTFQADAPRPFIRLEQMIEPYAPACAAMHAYLIRHYEIPEHVCHAMRNNFEVDGRMGEYPLCSYQAAYEQMCLKYPHMEQSEAAKLTDWKIGLLSEPPVFTKRALDLETMEWMVQVWNIRECSKELTEEVYAAYESEGEEVLLLLEALIGRMVLGESLSAGLPDLEISTVQPSVSCYEISLHNRDFWSYFLGAAYPYTNDGRSPKAGDYHAALSQYISRVYPPSAHFLAQFFKEEESISEKGTMHSILNPGRKELMFSFDGKEVRLIFTPHHLEYFLQGEPVFHQLLPFAQLAALSEAEEELMKFFLLLPITRVSEEAECREEILRRMKYLPFYKPTWNYLADCMVRNTDWEIKPDHPQKVLEEVYYSENTWNCFRGRLTGRKFQVDYKAPEGWYAMKLLHGESKGARAIEDKTERHRFMHQVVDGFLPPEPEPVKEISVAGKTALQKAEMLFEALIEKRHLCGGARGTWAEQKLLPATRKFLEKWDVHYFGGFNCSVTLWFGKKEEDSIPLCCYMFANDTWNPANTLFEVQGESKTAYLVREERLRRRIGEDFNIVGYFRVENVLPFPIGIGESGTFYTYFSHQMVMAESYPELLAQCVDLERLDRIEIDKGFRTVNKFTRKLENWYYHQYIRETNDMEYNYPYEVYRELFEEL